MANELTHSEQIHVLFGFLFILVGTIIILQNVNYLLLPWWKFLWPIFFLLGGIRLLTYDETEGKGSWLKSLQDTAVKQHKFLAVFLIISGLIEMMRSFKVIPLFSIWDYVFPAAFVFAGVLLLIRRDASWRAVLSHDIMGITCIAIGVLASLNRAIILATLFWYIAWPSLIIVLGVESMLFRGR